MINRNQAFKKSIHIYYLEIIMVKIGIKRYRVKKIKNFSYLLENKYILT